MEDCVKGIGTGKLVRSPWLPLWIHLPGHLTHNPIISMMQSHTLSFCWMIPSEYLSKSKQIFISNMLNLLFHIYIELILYMSVLGSPWIVELKISLFLWNISFRNEICMSCLSRYFLLKCCHIYIHLNILYVILNI